MMITSEPEFEEQVLRQCALVQHDLSRAEPQRGPSEGCCCCGVDDEEAWWRGQTRHLDTFLLVPELAAVFACECLLWAALERHHLNVELQRHGDRHQSRLRHAKHQVLLPSLEHRCRS
eukprot:3577392-Rhodomonas_salina.1